MHDESALKKTLVNLAFASSSIERNMAAEEMNSQINPNIKAESILFLYFRLLCVISLYASGGARRDRNTIKSEKGPVQHRRFSLLTARDSIIQSKPNHIHWPLWLVHSPSAWRQCDCPEMCLWLTWIPFFFLFCVRSFLLLFSFL